VGIDMDEDALQRATSRLQAVSAKFILKQANFRNLDTILVETGVMKANRILFDLGLSSFQFEVSGRGFSFQKEDEPLLMTFKKNLSESDLTVREIVNTWEEENIADILYGYAEETFSRKIAREIVSTREIKPIETTKDLVEIVYRATPGFYHRKKTHYATKTFQALRIAVNDEVEALREGLEKAYGALLPGGRMAVISFHSIEDRIVKLFFRQKQKDNEAHVITKKPIVPTREEIKENPRSRSAKLRAIKKK
jgi:16S rRNA (cytosine1402-N4)-methyltransferase